MPPEVSVQLAPARLKWLLALQIALVCASSLALGFVGLAVTKKARAYHEVQVQQLALESQRNALLKDIDNLKKDVSALKTDKASLAQRGSEVDAALAIAEGRKEAAPQAILLASNASEVSKTLASKLRPYATFERLGTKNYKGAQLVEFRLGVALPDDSKSQVNKVTYLFSPEHYKVNPTLESSNAGNGFEVTTKVWGCSGTVRLRVQLAAASEPPIEVVFDWCKVANWQTADLALAH